MHGQVEDICKQNPRNVRPASDATVSATASQVHVVKHTITRALNALTQHAHSLVHHSAMCEQMTGGRREALLYPHVQSFQLGLGAIDIDYWRVSWPSVADMKRCGGGLAGKDAHTPERWVSKRSRWVRVGSASASESSDDHDGLYHRLRRLLLRSASARTLALQISYQYVALDEIV
jgi:hypothetical protein